MIERVLRSARSFFWAVLLISLPVTSMPLIKLLVRSTAVASPSILALVALVGLWLIPFLLRRGRLSGLTLPLFLFAVVALISSIAAFFLPIPAFKDQNVLRVEAEAFITLAVGFSYYLVPATWVNSEDRLRSSLRWINYGGLLIILWSLAQAVAWFGFGRYPEWMRQFQDWISLGPMYRQRVTGFAIEPSWLAHQLNMLYLPVWLAASLTKLSAHRLRFKAITVENLLLAGGVVTLALSFSRVGLAAFLFVCSYLFVRANIWLVKKARGWLALRGADRAARPHLLTSGLVAGLILLYLLATLAGLFAFSRLDPRMADVFQYSYWREGGFLDYANQLQFGERAVYWQAGWEVYNRYPWLGVGMGNAGFFFADTIPGYGWKLVEVRRLMYRATDLPNTKNMWVRLLSETGIVGFSVFVSWLALLLQSARSLRSQPRPMLRLAGWVGVFVLLSFVFEGFSIDSFALPYFWISAGLLTAAYQIATKVQLHQQMGETSDLTVEVT